MEVFFEGKWGEARHKYPCTAWNIQPQRFHWYGAEWFLPAVYTCAHGLVFDLFFAVPMAEYRAFFDKWSALEEEELEAQEQIAEAENPLEKSVQYRMLVNGRELHDYSASGSSHVPELQEEEAPEFDGEEKLSALLELYGLLEQSPDCAWYHMRVQMPWATKRRPKAIRSLKLQLSAHDTLVSAPTVFEVAGDGAERMEIPFALPDGHVHTLCVLESTKDSLPEKAHIEDTDFRWPRAFSALRYTVEPALPEGIRLQLRDMAQGDRPVYIGSDMENAPVMGGAIGVILRGDKEERARLVASSSYFTVPETLQWRLCLYAKPAEDIVIALPCADELC